MSKADPGPCGSDPCRAAWYTDHLLPACRTRVLLAKKPQERYQSATDLLKEIDRVGRFTGTKV